MTTAKITPPITPALITGSAAATLSALELFVVVPDVMVSGSAVEIVVEIIGGEVGSGQSGSQGVSSRVSHSLSMKKRLGGTRIFAAPLIAQDWMSETRSVGLEVVVPMIMAL